MKQPECFVDSSYPDRVLKLKKSLYGLKQSGREWNSKLVVVLRDIGFSPRPSEPCFYINIHSTVRNIIAVYVNDFTITSHVSPNYYKSKRKFQRSSEWLLVIN